MEHFSDRVLILLDRTLDKSMLKTLRDNLFGCLAISITLLGYIFNIDQDLSQIMKNIMLFYGLKIMIDLDKSKEEKNLSINGNYQNSNLETDNSEQEETLESENHEPVEATEVHCIPTSQVYPQGYNYPFTSHSPQVISMREFISMFPNMRLPTTDRNIENPAVSIGGRTNSQSFNNRSRNNRNYRSPNHRASRNNISRLSANTQPFIPSRH